MGRKRLIALVVGVTMVVPLPGAALGTGTPSEVTEPVTDAVDADAGATEGGDVSVPLPGMGELSVGGEADPDAQRLEVRASADVTQEDLGVAAAPDATVGVSAEGPSIDAAAPVEAGPVAVDPVADVVAPVLDAVADVAPVPVPDVRPAQPSPTTPIATPGGDGDEVRGAALPGPGGIQEFDGPAPTVSVVRRSPQAPAPSVEDSPASAFGDEASPAIAPRETNATVQAAPALPAPVDVPMLLRLLAAVLVVATGLTNRVVARELR